MFALLISEGIGNGGVIPAGYCRTYGVSPSGTCYLGEFPIGGSCIGGLDPVGGSCGSCGAYPS